jgi:phosphoglycerate kinase
MKLRALPASLKKFDCARIYVRVDWNVPSHGGFGAEESLKLTRSYPLLRTLSEANAITLVLTHLGRPKKRESAFSTKPLAPVVAEHSGLRVKYLDVNLGTAEGRKTYARDLDQFVPGDVVLLENVRFQNGEEENDAELVHTYAEHADAFVNDAFASCHRDHASVVGLAKALPSYAGPGLLEEVHALEKLLTSAKRPYYAFIGGAKLSTKLPVIQKLLAHADGVYVGGAMAHPLLAAQGIKIGASFIEEEGRAAAKKIAKHKKLHLPKDAVVAARLSMNAKPRVAVIDRVRANDTIGDIGTTTMRTWCEDIRQAKTIVWNGPMGVAELPPFSHGSLVLGRAIAARAVGKAYGVVGGGDTLPIVARTGMQEDFDFVSTGGGAMLEFLANEGDIPGLRVLGGAQKK